MSSEALEGIEAVEVRRDVPMHLLALLPALMALLFGAAHPEATLRSAALTLATLWTLAVGWLWTSAPWARRERVRLTVDAEALCITDEATGAVRRVPRRPLSVDDARPLDVARAGVVLRHGVRRAAWLELQDRSTAERLLRRLGLGSGQRSLKAEGTSLLMQGYLMTWGAFLACVPLGILGTVGAQSAWPAVCAFLLLLVGLAAPSSVEVARDGVLLRWLFYRRFVPHLDIVSVRVVERARWTEPWFVGQQASALPDVVVIELRDGSSVRLPLVRGVAHPVAGAIRAARAKARPTETPLALARGELDDTGWARSLRHLDGGLRAPAVERAVLWRVAESPASAPTDRAAALVALGAPCSEEERERRASLEACTADPALRPALALPERCDDETAGRALRAADAGRARRASVTRRRAS